MDMNYLLSRHQVALVCAERAACRASHSAHRRLAEAYADQVRALRRRLGATAAPLMVA